MERCGGFNNQQSLINFKKPYAIKMQGIQIIHSNSDRTEYGFLHGAACFKIFDNH